MNISFTHILIGVIVVCIGLIALTRFSSFDTGPGKLDGFAQCLTEAKATFYGAFWCPHCQAQKALFGKSAQLLPYVECSLPDGKTRTPVCEEKDVQSYPTWEFADGSRVTGEQTLEALAAKTGCVLPE